MRFPIDKVVVSLLSAIPLGTAVHFLGVAGGFLGPASWLWPASILACAPLVWVFWTKLVSTPLRKVIFLSLLLASWVLGGGALLLSVFTGPFGMGGRREIHEASDCRMPLDVASCEGIDESFRECRYWVRAKGRPRPERCRRFLSRPPGEPLQGKCDFEKPEEWTPLPCNSMGMPARLICFACNHAEHEAGRGYVDAFDRDCTVEQITATCNMALDAR